MFEAGDFDLEQCLRNGAGTSSGIDKHTANPANVREIERAREIERKARIMNSVCVCSH